MSRQAAFCFQFCGDNCPGDNGMTHVDGALHAGASPAASELISLVHAALVVLTVRGASARSRLKADRGRYSACVNVLGSASQTASGHGPVPAGPRRHASEVGGGVQRRRRSAVCMRRVRCHAAFLWQSLVDFVPFELCRSSVRG